MRLFGWCGLFGCELPSFFPIGTVGLGLCCDGLFWGDYLIERCECFMVCNSLLRPWGPLMIDRAGMKEWKWNPYGAHLNVHLGLSK